MRRLEADVEPVGRLAAQLHRLQLPESRRRLHLAVDRTGIRFPPEGQGHAKMSIGPHLAAAQVLHNNRSDLLGESLRERRERVPRGRACMRCPSRQRLTRRTDTYYRRTARRAGGATCAADVATLTDLPSNALTFATPTRTRAFLPFIFPAHKNQFSVVITMSLVEEGRRDPALKKKG